MSAMIHLIARSNRKRKNGSCLTRIAEKFANSSENFWLCLSFLLFVVMGPFSIFAVLIGLVSLAKDKNNQEAPEPASL
ncbi:MAG: hypothetical protein ACLFV2_03890 [Desulfurivibrionaceae bacterium]